LRCNTTVVTTPCSLATSDTSPRTAAHRCWCTTDATPGWPTRCMSRPTGSWTSGDPGELGAVPCERAGSAHSTGVPARAGPRGLTLLGAGIADCPVRVAVDLGVLGGRCRRAPGKDSVELLLRQAPEAAAGLGQRRVDQSGLLVEDREPVVGAQ